MIEENLDIAMRVEFDIMCSRGCCVENTHVGVILGFHYKSYSKARYVTLYDETSNDFNYYTEVGEVNKVLDDCVDERTWKKILSNEQLDPSKESGRSYHFGPVDRFVRRDRRRSLLDTTDAIPEPHENVLELAEYQYTSSMKGMLMTPFNKLPKEAIRPWLIKAGFWMYSDDALEFIKNRNENPTNPTDDPPSPTESLTDLAGSVGNPFWGLGW